MIFGTGKLLFLQALDFRTSSLSLIFGTTPPARPALPHLIFLPCVATKRGDAQACRSRNAATQTLAQGIVYCPYLVRGGQLSPRVPRRDTGVHRDDNRQYPADAGQWRRRAVAARASGKPVSLRPVSPTSRFWAVYDGKDLVAVTVYRRGAQEVTDRLEVQERTIAELKRQIAALAMPHP